ncbi:MAG TPA: glutaredoxin domain-containing protein [Candidatus Nanoarchaeia archaeon]|nr:glutaredoxin domain-containing protein [Candidatus Nanoarchaeia archaeon]
MKKTAKLRNKSKPKKSLSVKVYTTITCPWCVKVKDFLKANNIKYTEVNVGLDEKARNDMFEKSGQFGVPVTDVNGTIIVGFDKEALKKALRL